MLQRGRRSMGSFGHIFQVLCFAKVISVNVFFFALYTYLL